MLRLIFRILAGATAACFMGAVAITFTITATRYLIGYSDPTAEYLSRYLIILGTFLGFPVAALLGLHVRFDLLDFLLPERFGAMLKRVTAVICCVICGIFAWYGIEFVQDSLMFGEVMPTRLEMPLWIPHLSIPIGMGLGAIAFLIVAIFPQSGEMSLDSEAHYSDGIEPETVLHDTPAADTRKA